MHVYVSMSVLVSAWPMDMTPYRVHVHSVHVVDSPVRVRKLAHARQHVGLY